MICLLTSREDILITHKKHFSQKMVKEFVYFHNSLTFIFKIYNMQIDSF